MSADLIKELLKHHAESDRLPRLEEETPSWIEALKELLASLLLAVEGLFQGVGLAGLGEVLIPLILWSVALVLIVTLILLVRRFLRTWPQKQTAPTASITSPLRDPLERAYEEAVSAGDEMKQLRIRWKIFLRFEHLDLCLTPNQYLAEMGEEESHSSPSYRETIRAKAHALYRGMFFDGDKARELVQFLLELNPDRGVSA